jgi:hypothetical protein
VGGRKTKTNAGAPGSASHVARAAKKVLVAAVASNVASNRAQNPPDWQSGKTTWSFFQCIGFDPAVFSLPENPMTLWKIEHDYLEIYISLGRKTQYPYTAEVIPGGVLLLRIMNAIFKLVPQHLSARARFRLDQRGPRDFTRKSPSQL